MIQERVDGVSLYRFEGLGGADGVVHAVLTRRGGVSAPPFATLNLGHMVGDDPQAVDENHRRALAALGLTPGQMVSPHQVHGEQVAVVGPSHAGTVVPATDGLVTDAPGLALVLRFADCVPVLFHDASKRAIGIAHAGWRGVVAGVVAATVRCLEKTWGCDSRDLWAGIGPCIGPCCYEVGRDVAEAVQGACPAGTGITRTEADRLHVDLPAAVRAQLEAAGIGQIEPAGICTACSTDAFYSHRAEDGNTGRFGVVMGLVP
jgi:YfiH family protein